MKNRWVIIALVVGGALVLCCGGTLMLGLVAGEEGGGDFAGARSLPSGCSDSVDGWHQAIGEGGLVLTREGATLELPWTFPVTDDMRANGDVDTAILRAVLGGRYDLAEQINRGPYGDKYRSGTATDRSSGRAVSFAFNSGTESGFASPVIVYADAQTIQNQFGSSDTLSPLWDLNRFSLGCTELEGTWKSGFSTAAERYSIGTGQFQGVEAVAAWRELKLESGSYARESNALVNRVFMKENDSGNWSHDDWSLTLEAEGGKVTGYNASLIAVQNGFLLRLQHKEFFRDVEDFRKVE
ncbi:MAG: hypothetical protein JNM17_06260 [Archangium sp.]|nr:hypothetical protein [Archangium sp.]